MPDTHMKAMILEQAGKPLVQRDCPLPEPSPDEIRIAVTACAVCRTDLHILDGELANPACPVILGHEIVGIVDKLGSAVKTFSAGQKVGVPWLASTCGHCSYCLCGKENLCDLAVFTGYQRNGGYAQFTVADSRFCFALPESYRDIQAAPLMCAGLIGWRSLKMTGDARNLGLYGFGASAHIIAQVARHQGRDVFAFTRPGDKKGQKFALSLGAVWAGASDAMPPLLLDAAIIFAPAGHLVPAALKATRKGGVVVCAGIHMSDIPSFSYDLLWGERSICSVANLTRADGEEFFAIAPQVPVSITVETYPLSQANEALTNLRNGLVKGAAVLVI